VAVTKAYAIRDEDMPLIDRISADRLFCSEST
jgi:hypothetical protein